MIPLRKMTVMIADDHALIAESVAGLLSSEYNVVAIAANGRQLLTEAARLSPDLIVLDISMPELNGIEAARQLQFTAPSAKVVFVTQHTAPQYLRTALRVGAQGYVAKQAAYHELRTALKEALAGRTYISPVLRELTAFAPVDELRRGRTDAEILTVRQRQILQLLSQGKTVRDMSVELHISTKTVEFHKKALMDQTGLRTTAELTRFAVANGFAAP